VGDVSWEDWKRVVDVNLNGSFLCARGAFRMMRDQDPMGGRIVNNGSISAYAPRPGSVAYTASKHAISGLTRTIALDGRPWDIACGQIDIGNAATPMTERMAKGVPQANGTMAVEPTMDVQHVADAVLHMASLPLSANILFMNVMATKMPFVGRG
jgi:NAD(P)-dependent dehydrogenase (short-subunit alcohol dehydrogenase family)